jgi:uncharacterized protein YbaA (DUF1428 family)
LKLLGSKLRRGYTWLSKAACILRRPRTPTEKENRMSYIDGFVAAVPDAKKAEYLQHATTAAAVFRKYGAMEVVETWGDDVPEGKLTSFPMAVKREAGETVVFSWIVWPDKKTRDEGMKKSMEDPALANVQMPFDGKRLIYGGFEVILKA